MDNPQMIRWSPHVFSHGLQAFLKAEDAERRLEQLKDQLKRASQQVPPQELSELSDWLKEQQEEVATFKAHCRNRQKQMESLLSDMNRYLQICPGLHVCVCPQPGLIVCSHVASDVSPRLDQCSHLTFKIKC